MVILNMVCGLESSFHDLLYQTGYRVIASAQSICQPQVSRGLETGKAAREGAKASQQRLGFIGIHEQQIIQLHESGQAAFVDTPGIVGTPTLKLVSGAECMETPVVQPLTHIALDRLLPDQCCGKRQHLPEVDTPASQGGDQNRRRRSFTQP